MTPFMVDVALIQDMRQLKQALDEGLFELRLAMNLARERRQPFMINIGMLAPDFHTVYSDNNSFPAAKIFGAQFH